MKIYLSYTLLFVSFFSSIAFADPTASIGQLPQGSELSFKVAKHVINAGVGFIDLGSVDTSNGIKIFCNLSTPSDYSKDRVIEGTVSVSNLSVQVTYGQDIREYTSVEFKGDFSYNGTPRSDLSLVCNSEWSNDLKIINFQSYFQALEGDLTIPAPQQF